MQDKVIFFRNDDVRHIIEDELVAFVDLFLNEDLPVSLAVEPANITEQVVGWLNNVKNNHPHLVEIIQHGYDHNKKGIYPEGTEFGKDRNYESQLVDLAKGKELMNAYFNDKWFPAMVFPYDRYNSPALKALDALDFKVLASMIHYSPKHRAKDLLGRLVSTDFILGKKVKQHNKIRKNYNFLEVDVSVDVIQRYIDEEKAIHYTLDEILEQINSNFKRTNVVGLLFHHRYHTDQFEMISQLIKALKRRGYKFSTIEQLHLNHKNA